MRTHAGLAALAVLAACGPDDPTGANPPVLWLFLDGVETEVLLTPVEPAPY